MYYIVKGNPNDFVTGGIDFGIWRYVINASFQFSRIDSFGSLWSLIAFGFTYGDTNLAIILGSSTTFHIMILIRLIWSINFFHYK